ncbi:hypothetical protein CLAIMM_13382 [Cladophialophora immunda]|nr:hypothetical protein CLAIMM_13382 [Cladophialophora immunda]
MARPASSTSDVCLYFLALFLPPLAVFFKTGCDSNFLINILLSILGWLPGVLRKSLFLNIIQPPPLFVLPSFPAHT